MQLQGLAIGDPGDELAQSAPQTLAVLGIPAPRLQHVVGLDHAHVGAVARDREPVGLDRGERQHPAEIVDATALLGELGGAIVGAHRRSSASASSHGNSSLSWSASPPHLVRRARPRR